MKVSKGSVFAPKNSPYLHLNLSVDGKRHRVNLELDKDIKENWEIAEKELLPLYRAEIKSGKIKLDKEEKVVKDFEYYSKLYLKTVDVEESTYRNYRSKVNKWIEFFKNKKIDEIKASDIEEVLLSLDIGRSTKAYYLSALKGVFHKALQDEVIVKSPLELIDLPRTKKEGNTIHPFEEHEVEKIISHAEGWFKNLMALAFLTGMRYGEMYALKWENVDFDRKRIFVNASKSDYHEGATKTKTSRYVPIFDDLLPYLKEQFKTTGFKTYVFYTDNNCRLKHNNVLKYRWEPLIKRIRIPYKNIYQTRHTFATTMLNSKNFTMNQVSYILGHKNVQMLIKHYNKFSVDEIDKIPKDFSLFCRDNCHKSFESPQQKGFA